ncbi:helix-turn-helix domain-containing protein [Candidatus Woesearchaeota archaeon]|nr:helix-turn-helix domain-containing protein [Candidatus Woesearchaeota archaeon]
MSGKSALLAKLFDEKTVKILKKLLIKKGVFYLRDLSRETGVSLATTYRIVQKLIKLGLVTKDKQDKFTFYRLLNDSPAYKELYSLIIGTAPDPISNIRKELENRYGAKKFSLYLLKGKEKKIFVVSKTANSAAVKSIISKVADKTGKKFNHIVLKPTQFSQMQEIGLINRDKLEMI